LGENWAVIEEYAKILDYIIVISLTSIDCQLHHI
jgi:hypothetical protein